MARAENRYMRIEDWKGNVYYPETAESSTAGLISSKASNEPGSDPYTEGEYVPDYKANQKESIQIDHPGEKIIYRGSFIKIPFGDVAVGIRMKRGALDHSLSEDTEIASISFYFKDEDFQITQDDVPFETFSIKANELEYDEYTTIPYIINWKVPDDINSYNNPGLVVELKKKNTGVSVRTNFDIMYVTLFAGKKQQGSGGGSNITVRNRTIVVS